MSVIGELQRHLALARAALDEEGCAELAADLAARGPHSDADLPSSARSILDSLARSDLAAGDESHAFRGLSAHARERVESLGAICRIILGV